MAAQHLLGRRHVQPMSLLWNDFEIDVPELASNDDRRAGTHRVLLTDEQQSRTGERGEARRQRVVGEARETTGHVCETPRVAVEVARRAVDGAGEAGDTAFLSGARDLLVPTSRLRAALARGPEQHQGRHALGIRERRRHGDDAAE